MKSVVVKFSILVYFLCLHSSLHCYAQEQNEPPPLVINNVVYINGDTLMADFYLPASYQNQPNPVLLFINGFGSDFRTWDHYKDWAKFAASEGFIGVIYSSRKEYARESFKKILDHIINASGKYDADTSRIGVYAGSGNVVNGLPYANDDKRVKAALMYYGNAKMENFRLDMPVLLTRAGLDNIHLNKQLDSLAFTALKANAPYTIINFNTAPHAFEDVHDPEVKSMMKASLDFLATNMRKIVRENFLKKENEIVAMRELYGSNWTAALTALKLALKNDPGNNETERQIGNVYVELKEYDKAMSSFNDALTHGNWRKGEIARKKLFLYAKMNDINAAVSEMRVLKKIGWFNEADYTADEYSAIIKSGIYKKFKSEQ